MYNIAETLISFGSEIHNYLSLPMTRRTKEQVYLWKFYANILSNLGKYFFIFFS